MNHGNLEYSIQYSVKASLDMASQHDFKDFKKTKTTNWHTPLDNQASTRKSHALQGPASGPNPIPSTGRPVFMKIGAEHPKTQANWT